MPKRRWREEHTLGPPRRRSFTLEAFKNDLIQRPDYSVPHLKALRQAKGLRCNASKSSNVASRVDS